MVVNKRCYDCYLIQSSDNNNQCNSNNVKIKSISISMVTQPGPASTVEERSLRKISSEGTVVRNSPWICLFRRDLFFSRKKCFAHKFGGFSISDKSINLRNLEKGMAVASNLLLYEEET